MPSKEPRFQSQLTGEVSDFLDRKRRTKYGGGSKDGSEDVEFLTIVEFIEKFKLFPYGLFPVQKFIVKLYYGLPLDDVQKTIKLKDRDTDRILNEFTEVEYLAYLYDQGRCNIRVQDGKVRHEIILVLGRRSGKSALAAIFAAYELYKLLKRGCPQSYYGLPAGSEIRVLDIANDKEQASIVYGDIQAHIQAVDYFKNNVAHDTQTYVKFRTDNDRKKFGPDGKATITATFKSSIAKGLRGRGIICAILDEIAFFIDDGKSSAERVYKGLAPSLKQFAPKDPKNKHQAVGPTDGRMILISSPDAKEGFLYRQYQQAMSGGIEASNTLVIQAPTWEVNPTLSSEDYRVEYAKDPKSFMTEYGAEFSDRVRGFIEDWKDLSDCIVPTLRPASRGYPREAHWAGVDFGLSNDGTAIALTHLSAGRIELAYHEVWYPRRSWREANPHLEAPMVPYAMTLQDRARLDLDEIAAWFHALSRRFYIHRGVFDQWAGPVFEQVLHKKNLQQFEMRNFFPSETSQMWQTFKMAMFNRQLALYDYPLPESASAESGSVRHSPLVSELLELQSTSGGKNIIVVEAPKVQGKHDDMSDALARSIMLAMEYVRDNPGVLDSAGRQVSANHGPASGVGYHQYHRARARLHGMSGIRTAPRQAKRIF